MKLRDCINLKAIHFKDRTILKSDFDSLSYIQLLELDKIEVEPIEDRKGHYKVKES